MNTIASKQRFRCFAKHPQHATANDVAFKGTFDE